MYQQQRIAVGLADELRGQLAELVDRLIDEESNADGFNEALMLLESLPLASGPFAVAVNRLNSARRYLAAGERGAARYELRLLVGGLCADAHARAIDRRRLRVRA
jgi:hypothetical protein